MSPSSHRLETLLYADQPAVYIIAEVGSNHGGSLEQALAYIDACAAAGVDAVKFQSWQTERLHNRLDPVTDQLAAAIPILQRYQLPEEWHPTLAAACQAAGVAFLSTPFDPQRARLLRTLDVPAIKIASGDLTYTQLLQEVAGYSLPILLSTGMAELEEVEQALETLGPARDRAVLLHCVGAYPPRLEDAQLRSLPALATRFGLPVGLSDHYPGHTTAVAAVALGARVIEKHVTFSRAAGHPDSPFALELDELAALVRAVRLTEQALGDGSKRCRESEVGGRSGGRRSLYWQADLPAGSTISAAHLAPLRPAAGEFAPADLDRLVGCTTCRAVRAHRSVAQADLLEPLP